jgi:serine/threonine-protein kinase
MTSPLDRLTTALAGRYTIERELGAGGMATVYLAHDVRHDRKVALKVLRPELSAILGGERFLAEIKTTANLQHPHILSLFDSGEADGQVFYVMPYVDGESLRDRLSREKQLSVEDAVRIAREIADALAYAHGLGVVHRDIKPENILLHGGHAMVADFGIALAASRSDGGTRMTETGMSLGTPHYMSPEQAMGEREITARSDVYALGCVLYEMLMGEPPFTGPTAQAIIAKVMTDAPHALTLHRKTIPPHVEQAVLQALQKLPADRFATAADFSAALDGRFATRVTSYGPGASAPAGRWRRVAIAAGAVAVVAVAVALWALRRVPEAPVTRVSISFPASERLKSTSTRRLAISRDGRRIVYIGPDTVGTQLWVRELDALSARPLPGTANALAPFFSPDGMSVAYFTGSPGDLRVVSVTGGPALTLVRDSANPFGGDWGDDGYLYFNNQDSRIGRVPAGGGAVATVSTLDSALGQTEHDWPELLPGGTAALVQIWHTSIGDAEVGVLDLESGRVTPLMVAAYGRYLPTGHILYASFNGALLAVPFDARRREVTGAPMAVAEGVQVDPYSGSAQFAVSHTGTLLYMPGGGVGSEQVVWVDRSGRLTPVDSGWRGNFGNVELSPDGSRLAVSVVSTDGEQVWVKQLPTGPLSRLTFGGSANVRPSWTPDGRRVAFISNRTGGRRNAFVQRFDGSAEAESLMASPRQVDEIAWSPDGRTALFRLGSGGSRTRDIQALTLGQDTAPRPLVAGAFDEFGADVAPGGRWFAYVSSESGRSEVYVRLLGDPGAGRVQVSVDGGEEPRWAHSGRELFFRTRRGEMMVADVTLGAAFTARPPRVLFSLPNLATDPNHRGYDVARDDRRFVMINRSMSEATDVVMVLYWFAEFRARGTGTR